jgi:G6PDH family F420-dependent oxidoreductase
MMTRFGYTLMTEQSGPRELVSYARGAERAGFDFAVMSDHYSPWLATQGHAPYAWSTLGAVSQVTERIDLMTYVTCPIMRYHPAVVAQKAATMQILSEGRFTLGLGAGENLNEHVVGRGWPPVNVRHDMLSEAIDIIRQLLAGEDLTYQGQHFSVDSARLWDRPEGGVPLATAVSGDQSIRLFAAKSDAMIAVEPTSALVDGWDGHSGRTGDRKIGQLPICWDPSRDKAISRAHDQFRWFGGGWKVNAELPGPAGFAGATQFVRPEDVADSVPCGPDTEAIVAAIGEYSDAGFTDVAVVQIGDESQHDFLSYAESELLPALRGR